MLASPPSRTILKKKCNDNGAAEARSVVGGDGGGGGDCGGGGDYGDCGDCGGGGGGGGDCGGVGSGGFGGGSWLLWSVLALRFEEEAKARTYPLCPVGLLMSTTHQTAIRALAGVVIDTRLLLFFPVFFVLVDIYLLLLYVCVCVCVFFSYYGGP